MKKVIFVMIFASIFISACQVESVYENDEEFNELVASGNKKMTEKDSNGAIKDYTKALEIEETPEVLFSLASAKFFINDFKGALKDINKVLQMKKDSFYYVRRAEIYSAMRDSDNALDSINEAITMNDKEPWSYYIRSNLKFEKGDNQGALNDISVALTKDIRIKAERGQYYAQMAKIKFAMGDIKKALEDINKGIEIIESEQNSNNPDERLSEVEMMELYKNRADIKFAFGDTDGAQEDVKKLESFKK